MKELDQENFEKLKRLIEKYGFLFPFFVWKNKRNNKWYYTDGTQRHKVLTWMKESGVYDLPEKFPCVEIMAKNKSEAAKAILAQSTSFGEITQPGLEAFFREFGLDFDFGEMAEFQLSEFMDAIEKVEEVEDRDELWDGMPEYGSEDLMGVQKIIVHFQTEEDVETFGRMIKQNVTNKTKYIWFPKRDDKDLKRYYAEDESE